MPSALPNVLLILADQYRWDCVGANGNALIHTPQLDALARNGGAGVAAAHLRLLLRPVQLDR